jgi:hypothetical protein
MFINWMPSNTTVVDTEQFCTVEHKPLSPSNQIRDKQGETDNNAQEDFMYKIALTSTF